MTQVPCDVDTPSAPAMLGTETLAIETSRMATKLASASNTPDIHITMPLSWWGLGATLVASSAVASAVDMASSWKKIKQSRADVATR